MESIVNPETGKPNPISLKELSIMDPHELKAFTKGMTMKESFDFQIAYAVAETALPTNKKIEYARERIKKLESREKKSIPDKVKILLEKQYIKNLASSPRKEVHWPKWIKETKSPYLIKPVGIG